MNAATHYGGHANGGVVHPDKPGVLSIREGRVCDPFHSIPYHSNTYGEPRAESSSAPVMSCLSPMCCTVLRFGPCTTWIMRRGAMHGPSKLEARSAAGWCHGQLQHMLSLKQCILSHAEQAAEQGRQSNHTGYDAHALK